MTATEGALDGVRVIDVGSFLAGPSVSMYLGDFGAEVIKIERPVSGDESRLWGHHKNGVGLYHKVLNRNKRSITADLHTPIGREILTRLASVSDVVVENFRPGTLERWGLGYDTLAAENERLVLTRITGFGQTGPYSPRPGFGTLAEAFSGYASITGYPDRPPLLPGFGLADATAGLMGAFLTMVAVHAARAGGVGQVVDLAIYEPLFSMLGPHVVDYDQLGVVQQRSGSRLPFTAPRNTYQTADGSWVAIAGSSQSVFVRICAALDRPDLVADPRFLDNRMRMTHAAELDLEIAGEVGKHPLDRLLAVFHEHSAAIAPVYTVAQAVDDPQYQARENVVRVDDDELGPMSMQNVVGRLSRTPGSVRSTGPRLGVDNRSILVDELGFTERELADAGLVLETEADALP